jgi:integrase
MKTVKDGRFPVKVTEGGVSAKIRKITQTKSGKPYVIYLADYILLGKRKQVGRSTFDEAKQIALNACRQIANGQHLSLTLTNDDRMMYLRATEALAPTGLKLDAAILDYIAAVKNLPNGASLNEAVDFYRRRNPSALEKRTVRQVAEEMLAVKRAAKLSEIHLKDLKGQLERFAGAFEINISEVSTKAIQSWLDKLTVAGRTKRNYLKVLHSLFGFAIRQKYLPKEAMDEVKAVQAPKEDAGEIEIFSPVEMGEILAVATPEMIPWLAVGAFAGLRSAEIERLDWREVNLAERYIEIKASKAKTAARRLVPITDNLAQWLTPYAKECGSIIQGVCWEQIPQLVERVNRKRLEAKASATFAWKHNALRHSFCSYRLAMIKNTAQVALEAGNTPKIIFKHYRQLVTESGATKWFSIRPEQPGNVVLLARTPEVAA